MKTELITVSPGPTSSVNDTLTLGKVLAESGYFPDARAAGQAVVKVLAGREMGIGPVQSMTGINVIKGKVSLSANLMAALIRRSGRYDYRIKQLNDQRCEIEFLMDSRSVGVSTLTIDDAKKAGLLTGDNWKKYPRNMLFARAMSNGAKWFCPDIFAGPVYTPDELGAAVDVEDASFVAVQSQPTRGLPAAKTISEEEAEELDRLIRRKGADRVKLLAYYQAESVLDLSPAQFVEAVGALNGRPDVPQDAAGCVPVCEDNVPKNEE